MNLSKNSNVGLFITCIRICNLSFVILFCIKWVHKEKEHRQVVCKLYIASKLHFS